MGNQEKNDGNLGTLITGLAVISTKIDNLMEKFEKLENQLETKVSASTFEAHLESHKNYLKNLDDRLVEERKHRENIKEDIAYSKGAARMAGGVWGTISSVLIGIATHFFTK